MRTRLIFVRHAEAEGNAIRRFHGWTDSLITEKGHMQARSVAERLKDTPVDIIYSSSMKRTLQTCEYIAKVKGLPIIRTDKLKEINGGDWEDKRWDELPEKWPVENDTWENKPHLHRMPNGETMVEFQERLLKEVHKIINDNKGKNICIVTHGTAIRAMMCQFQSCDLVEMVNIPWYDNTSVTIIDYEDKEFKVVLEGDASHLNKELSTLQNQSWWSDHMENIKSRENNADQDSGGKEMSKNKLVSWLFETNAVRVCPENKPFWYTSGTIGPYYINTHFLYGSEEKANTLLKTIDVEKNDIFTCPDKLLDITRKNYETDKIYKGLIDEMCSFIKENISVSEIDYISGGERRDWFFSLIIAQLLNKPHITIYKDLKAVITENGSTKEINSIEGKKVLHIADLITEASSYERAWIPAIRNAGGEIKWSVVVVDRKQGGEELLSREGVKSFAMVSIDKALFDKVLEMELINKEQYEMLLNYIKSPKDSMKNFLKEHPEFLENALNSDEKTKERARLCIEKKIYE